MPPERPGRHFRFTILVSAGSAKTSVVLSKKKFWQNRRTIIVFVDALKSIYSLNARTRQVQSIGILVFILDQLATTGVIWVTAGMPSCDRRFLGF
jgi:hypothetical protein